MARTQVSKSERRSRLVTAIRQSGMLPLGELARVVGCSPITIRRDIEEINRSLPSVVIEGGHVRWVSNRVLRQFEAEMALQREAKQDIAEAVVARLQPGMTVAIDGGTTTTYVARALIQARSIRPITVLTNAVNIAYEMYGWDDLHVIMLGGTVATQKYEVLGSLLTRGVERFWADVAVLGCYGVLETVVTAYTQQSAEASQAMLGRARQVWVVCDRTKFGRAGTATICEIDRVDTVITDGVPAAQRGWIQPNKVATVRVPPEDARGERRA